MSDQPHEQDEQCYVTPCPHCGEACRGTVVMLASGSGPMIRFEVDRPTFDELLDPLVGNAVAANAYADLPQFVREWNEGTGWCEEPRAVDGHDLQRTLDALRREHESAERRNLDLLTALDAFVTRARRDGRPIVVQET